MKMRPLLLAAATTLSAFGAHAGSINALNALSQSDFRLLSEDLGAAVSYKPLVPAESLGIIGFDVGVGLGATKLQSTNVLNQASGGSIDLSTLPFAMVRAHKGLPMNIDVGVALGTLPGTGVSTKGAELRWAFLPGSMVTPAVAVRGAYSSMSGVSQLDVNTTSLDVSISKGFLFLKPYAGVGIVQVKSTPNGVASLQAESFTQPKTFVGLNMNFMLLNLAIEGDKTGSNTSYGIKLGVRF
ncbi:MAG: hypothetical protein AB3X41_05565 [Leptothrix ochracea]|uniref:hypothetical protein n=1 Tax=Leptothrix ochracea TaxID=735331 RepID=UPI0034E25362